MTDNEDRYEAIELVLKTRSDGTSWFDYLFDLITENCEGGGGECILAEGEESDCDDHEHTDLLPCTCGLESMGGSSGTIEQCFEYRNNVAAGISPIMLARVITDLFVRDYTNEDIQKVVNWAYKEIEFEDYFENKEWENEAPSCECLGDARCVEHFLAELDEEENGEEE